jgi:hypothetical protein
MPRIYKLLTSTLGFFIRSGATAIAHWRRVARFQVPVESVRKWPVVPTVPVGHAMAGHDGTIMI